MLSSTETLGPRVGATLSAALLFAPALVALGTTGPIAVKLATKELQTRSWPLSTLLTGSLHAVTAELGLCKRSYLE